MNFDITTTFATPQVSVHTTILLAAVSLQLIVIGFSIFTSAGQVRQCSQHHHYDDYYYHYYQQRCRY